MKRKNFQKGFSFVEVMVAMVILSISLVILMESQTRSMDLVSRGRSIDDAVTLASERMGELTNLVGAKGISALKSEEHGDFDQDKYPGFHWKYLVVAVPAPDFVGLMTAATGTADEKAEKNAGANNAALLGGPLQMITKMWGEAIKEIHLEISWKDGAREKTYDLVTHVISADAGTQIQGLMGAMTSGLGSLGGGAGQAGKPPSGLGGLGGGAGQAGKTP